MNKKKKNVNVKHRKNKQRVRGLRHESLLKAKPKLVAKKKVEVSSESSSVKKPAAKKPAAKKAATKKPAAKKAATKKSVAKKVADKK